MDAEDQSSPDSVEALKLLVARMSPPRFGAFAEFVYQAELERRGDVVKGVHENGVDFLVNRTTKEDLKAQRLIKCHSGILSRVRSVTYRIPGVSYPLMVFFADAIVVFDSNDGLRERFRMTWEEVVSLHAKFHRRKKTRVTPVVEVPKTGKAARSRIAAELRAWIANEWGLRAKTVVRGNRATQDQMGQSGWGPEAFYHSPDDQRRPVDLVVLLFFEGVEDYAVFAYPMSLHGEIEWYPKKVGPNPGGRMTFDPRKLDDRFKFSSIAEFMQDFLRRFKDFLRGFGDQLS